MTNAEWEQAVEVGGDYDAPDLVHETRKVGQLENEDTHVTNLYEHVRAGVYHYAAIRWRWRSPFVLWTAQSLVPVIFKWPED